MQIFNIEINKNNIIFFIAPVAVVIIIIVAILGLRPSPLSSAKIIFWGFEDQEVYRLLFKDFQAAYSYIDIEYVQKSPETYEKELLSAMASGQGPDVFAIKNSWLPRYQDKISPLPAKLMALKTYYDSFVDVAVQDFVADGNIYGIPWCVDTLALYWNKDFFNTVGIASPPKNWDEFVEDVQKITLNDENGNISRAGAAIGASSNVENATDILSLLMMQSGAKMIESKTRAGFNQETMVKGEQFKPGRDALEFYVNFSNPQYKAYTWNNRMDNSLNSFIQGKAAMIFDYSSAAEKISEQAPYLNFSIAPMPQVKDTNIAITYGNYWGESVWLGSKSPNEAWTFISWMASQNSQKRYLDLVKKPASRRDVVPLQENDPVLGVFAKQSLSARSWYQFDDAAIKEIFIQMIDSVFYSRATFNDAVERAAGQISSLMSEAQNKNK